MAEIQSSPEIEVTHWLKLWSEGDEEARDHLVARLYPSLRRLVGSYRNRRGQRPVLETTELLHELYFHLVGQDQVVWQDRSHFFAVAGRLLRRVIIDDERRHRRTKRGGAKEDLPLEEALTVAVLESSEPIDVLVLDDALVQLETIDPRAARVVELRFFAGLDHDETARALGIGRATVGRSWRFARAWLRQYLEGEKAENGR